LTKSYLFCLTENIKKIKSLT